MIKMVSPSPQKNICIWASGCFEQWYSSYHLMLKIIQEILQSGHEVWLVQPQYKDGKIPKELEGENNLHIVNVPQKATPKNSFLLRYLRGVNYFIESGHIIKTIPNLDVIFLQSNTNAVIPVLFARRLHIPIVYNVQDIFPIDALIASKISKWNPAFWFFRFLQSIAYKKASRVITISNDLKQTIQNEGRKDVDVIFNWSYQNDPYIIDDKQNHFLMSNGINRNDFFRVIYAGNIGQMLDINMFVQCARKLSSIKDIRILIIGEGTNLNKLKERVKNEGLNNFLFFNRQPMEYAKDNYCAADVNINPVPKGVIYTCMPSKTATCLLSEKPTVVSMDLDSDMSKKLSTVDQWTVVAPGDYNAMAEAILRIYNGKRSVSTNAVEFLNKYCSVNNAKQYVKILEESAL